MALSARNRLHNGGYSVIEHWVGSQTAGDAVRIGGTGSEALAATPQTGTIVAAALFQLIVTAAMAVDDLSSPAELSGRGFNPDELMGSLLILPGGCLRSVVVDKGTGYCTTINFQDNGDSAPLYVDFVMTGVPTASNITLDFQHSMIA